MSAAALRKALAAFDELDCGDNSCWFAKRPRTGMRTNGGCRCMERQCAGAPVHTSTKIRALIEAAKVAADELEKEAKL